uniref:Reverse transcriptase domain-containing protein n=1 Tax=Lactuca sativa TaxID=4236 RepID=A0A9R1VCA4_LACSA|nr:hypothetical protein LSAT_V11C500285080 [Lactuca sativa]
MEVEKTIDVGRLVGFQLKGSEDSLKTIIEGEGVGEGFEKEETQMKVSSVDLEQFWDNSTYGWEAVDSYGRSGGGGGEKVNVVNVYAPIDREERLCLWNELKELKNVRDGIWLFMGDFNEVRCKEDRFSMLVCNSSMEEFNSFIRDCELVEFNMGGRKFTWMSPDGKRLSKIDRFLVNDLFLETWTFVAVTALPRLHSDHCPIVLISDYVDFGPIPFKFFNSWLLLDGLSDVVRISWEKNLENRRYDLNLLKKLRRLKGDIKLWRNSLRLKENEEMSNLTKKVDWLELQAGTQPLSSLEREMRKKWLQRINEIDDIKRLDLKQKAIIRWDVDGMKIAEEIKKAIWSCGNDKASGPDGFTFKFLKEYWEVLKEDIVNFVKEFEVMGRISNGCNASFISLITKKSDPLVLSDYRPVNLIGCMYKIIFKILATRLKMIMEKIIGLEQSAYVEGRTMEGLSVCLKDACDHLILRGISLPNNGPILSHLMYADDVMIVGEWYELNFINLNRILRCFHLSSGLKVNLGKSKVFGIGVDNLDIDRLASILHCEPGCFPFKYLGLPIGANMNLVKSWNSIIEKFKNKLSIWKAKNLSFGGRLTLVKSVLGSLPLFYFALFKAPKKVIAVLEGIRRRFLWGGVENCKKIHWVAWETITRPKKLGGFGVGDLRSMNIALLAKWWWRFRVEQNSLWSSCIRALHNTRGIDGMAFARCGIPGPWLKIYQINWELDEWNIGLDDLFCRKLGDGKHTHFWKDKWCGDIILRMEFPELYKIESEKNCKVSDRINIGDSVVFQGMWKRCPRSGRESVELEKMTSMVADTTLSRKTDS